MAVDFDALVIGPAVSTFGRAVTYYPFQPLLHPNGTQMFDDNGDPLGNFGAGYPATGVFDEQFVEVAPMGDGPFPASEAMEYGAPGGISEAMPVLGVQLSAMQTTPIQGDKVVIGSQTYLVREPRPDGHGWAKLLLNLT